MSENLAEVVDREKATVGAIVLGFDHEEQKAIVGRVIERKTLTDGRVEVKVKYEDGVEVWLPTYVCRSH